MFIFPVNTSNLLKMAAFFPHSNSYRQRNKTFKWPVIPGVNFVPINTKLTFMKDTTKRHGQWPREQRRRNLSSRLLLPQFFISDHKLLQFLQQIGVQSRQSGILRAVIWSRRRIINIVARIIPSSNHYHLVQLIEKQHGVQKRKHLQPRKKKVHFPSIKWRKYIYNIWFSNEMNRELGIGRKREYLR